MGCMHKMIKCAYGRFNLEKNSRGYTRVWEKHPPCQTHLQHDMRTAPLMLCINRRAQPAYRSPTAANRTAEMHGYHLPVFNIRILSVSVKIKNYPYPYPIRSDIVNCYPYPIRTRSIDNESKKNFPQYFHCSFNSTLVVRF